MSMKLIELGNDIISHRREVALYNIDMYTTVGVLITGGVPYLSRFSTWVLRT